MCDMLNGSLDSHRCTEFLPLILDRVHPRFDGHAAKRHPVTLFDLAGWRLYFSTHILNSASVVIANDPPKPPLSALGLSEFAIFEHQQISGITYLDTYFRDPTAARDESAHFYETGPRSPVTSFGTGRFPVAVRRCEG